MREVLLAVGLGKLLVYLLSYTPGLSVNSIFL